MFDRRLFFNTSLIIIYTTNLFSNLAFFMVVPFFATYLTSLDHLSSTDIGIIIGLAFWFQRAGSILGGLCSDFINTRFTMILGLLLRIPGFFILTFASDFYSLTLAYSLISLGVSLYIPASKSAVINVTLPELRISALSIRIISSYIGVLLGPIVGYYLYISSPFNLFIVIAFIFLLMSILSTYLPNFKDDSIELPKFSEIFILLQSYPLWVLNGIFFIYSFLYVQLEITLPIFIEQLFDEKMLSLIFVINAIVIILFQMPLGRWSCLSRRSVVLLFGYACYAISFLFFSFLKDSSLQLFLGIIFFSFATISFVSRSDYDCLHINPKMVASTMGIVSISAAFGAFLGSYFGSSFKNVLLFTWYNFEIWDALFLACLFCCGFLFLPFQNLLNYPKKIIYKK